MQHTKTIPLLLVLFCLLLSSTLCAQTPRALPNSLRDTKSNSPKAVELLLRSRTDCPANLILLSDLVSVQGSDALVKGLMETALGPAPRMGADQSWSRIEIEKSLALRGIPADKIRWKGANECIVRRTQGTRPERRENKPNEHATEDEVAKIIQLASGQEPRSTMAINNSGVQNALATIDKSQFTAPFVTPANVSQSENLAARIISDYLQTKTDSAGRWLIKVNMPTEYAKIFSLRNNILGVTGGQPPWDGPQEFAFRVVSKEGEKIISLSAEVKLPDMVVATKRTLSKGYVLKEEDLVWIPMPRGLNYGPEDCFSKPEDLVGQQLRRSMSMQQVIRLKEVGPPAVVHVGDLVTIGIVSGGVSVETNGRAIEAGAIDDLIQIEVQPHRKRIMARITGERTAEVISNGAVNAGQPARAIASKSNTNFPR